MKRSSNSSKTRGATLVEFALLLPVFALLVFSLIDFGRAYHIYQTMTNAAREGARYAVAPFPGTSTLPTDVPSRVCAFLGAANIACGGGPQHATVTVAPTTRTINGVPTTYTQVTVTYTQYQFLFFPSVNMTATSVMRDETN